MSSNDNAMARFLFAILKQKDLKDIDWNKVAQDPVLTAPISNGHAARMRYSRFRSSVLGIEPQRRNRAAANPTTTKPARVTKRKKTDKSIKSEDNEEDDVLSPTDQASLSYPNMKEDDLFITPARSSTTHHSRMQMRLLTPCSDSETALTTPQGYSPSPVATTTPFDFTGGGGGVAAGAAAHNPAAGQWHSAFDEFTTDAYDMSGYGPGVGGSAFCDHHQVEEALRIHEAMLEQEGSQLVPVKHEDWDGSGGVTGGHYQQAGHC